MHLHRNHDVVGPRRRARPRGPTTSPIAANSGTSHEERVASYLGEEMVMQAIAVMMALVVSFTTSTLARAQQTSDCKSCREYQQACLKNHTRDACNNEYNICMKYCRKK
jgi:hypothetical protein